MESGAAASAASARQRRRRGRTGEKKRIADGGRGGNRKSGTRMDGTESGDLVPDFRGRGTGARSEHIPRPKAPRIYGSTDLVSLLTYIIDLRPVSILLVPRAHSSGGAGRP